MTCEDLCANRADDLDTLGALEEVPTELGAHTRMITLKKLAAVRAKVRLKKCPSC
jgi:hypothetical protein